MKKSKGKITKIPTIVSQPICGGVLSIKTASVHLWIEEINTGRKWHYKYPLLNGNINANLKIDSTLKPGNYAFNFMMQRKAKCIICMSLTTDQGLNCPLVRY
jgi:hypothetical protein